MIKKIKSKKTEIIIGKEIIMMKMVIKRIK